MLLDLAPLPHVCAFGLRLGISGALLSRAKMSSCRGKYKIEYLIDSIFGYKIVILTDEFHITFHDAVTVPFAGFSLHACSK